MKTNESNSIECPNYTWKLFQRDGVYYADGRRHQLGKHSLNTRERSDAIHELYKLDAGVAVGALNTPVISTSDDQPKSISIEGGWDKYLASRGGPVYLDGLKPASKKQYTYYKNAFVEYCLGAGIKCWSQVDKTVLRNFGDYIDGRFAPRTVHNNLTMQVSVSNWLIAEDLIPDSCKIKWKLKKPVGSERYCYTREQVTRMLEFSKADMTLHWLHAMIMLLSRTGLRIGEARALRWTDVDVDRGVIHIRDESFSNVTNGVRRTVKNGQSRSVFIHSDLGEYLHEVQGSGYVLYAVKGGQLNENYARERFIEKVIEPLTKEFPSPAGEVGFADGRLHSFRHFFVSEAFASGVPECDIRDCVGHSDSKIVELYRHLRSETAKANIQRIEFGT